MQSTTRFSFPVLALATAMLFSSGCSSKPNDTQLTSNVQSAITADPALKGQSISVAARDGTVTLTGAVDAEATRELASRDAAGVKGTRTVVNNLSVGGAAPAGNPYAGNSAENQPPANPPAARKTAPPPSSRAATPAPAKAASQALVIPSGTRLRVRLGKTLSSNNSQTGESFSGTLVNSVRVDGRTLIPAGARVRGTVTDAKDMGHFKGQAELALRLESVSAQGRSYPIQTSRIERAEKGKGKRSAIMTGGGAGLGALIGGLAGGGKGALIGGLVGGGGGAAGSAFTGNKDIVLPAETVLTFVLEQSVTVR